MTKALVAARMNEMDQIQAVLNAGTKATTTRQSKRTFKLVEMVPNDILLIENPDGQVMASIMKGSGKNWQLVTADMSTIVNYKRRPSLVECLAELK